MTAGAPRIATTRYIAMFDEVLASVLGSGAPGDWNKLQRRLDALAARVRTDAAARERGAPGWPYRLERDLWIEVLTESMDPEALARLAQTLLDATEAVDPTVWSALDVVVSAQATKRTDRRKARAEAAVLTALHRYAAAPRLPRIVEGIRALEELHEARISTDPVWDQGVLEKEARRLGEAMTAMFPPRVRLTLRDVVESSFRSEIEEMLDELEPTRLFWYHHIPGVGFWYPAWSHVLHGGGLREEGGTWFVGKTQAAYEKALARDFDTADKTSEMAPSDTSPPSADGAGTDELIPPPGSGPPEPQEDEPEPPRAAVAQERQQIPSEPPAAVPPPAEIGMYDAAEEAIVMQRAEARLRVWCRGQRMIPTPKHLVSSERGRLMSQFAIEIREEMRTRTDKN